MDDKLSKLQERIKKFEELKAKSSEIKTRSFLRSQKTEMLRSRKLIRKALKDPCIKAAVEGSSLSDSEEVKTDSETKWEDVKPFLSVNEHLQGPVLHGDCGPKTELESKIEDCIKEGDFEQAEILSDTLADRQFAVKISSAFAAKKYQEKLEMEKKQQKTKEMKKIRWMFDAKERWQMKGNM